MALVSGSSTCQGDRFFCMAVVNSLKCSHQEFASYPVHQSICPHLSVRWIVSQGSQARVWNGDSSHLWSFLLESCRKRAEPPSSSSVGELRGSKEMGELAVFVLGTSRASHLTLMATLAQPSHLMATPHGVGGIPGCPGR